MGIRETSSGAVYALPLNQVLYPALDLLRICMKVRKQLLCGLGHKLLMRKAPAHLHDADYGCIDLERSIHLDHLPATRRVKLSLISNAEAQTQAHTSCSNLIDAVSKRVIWLPFS